MMTDAGTTQTRSSTSSATRFGRGWRADGLGIGVSFSPAVSGKALKAIRQTVRRWTLHERSDKTLDDLARMFNTHIRGWINYYGRFYQSALYPTLRHIDRILARWACRKFKCLGQAQATGTSLAGAHRAPSDQICSPTGACSMDAAEQWEPDDARASRPVLRERGGEIPPRHSTATSMFAAGAPVNG